MKANSLLSILIFGLSGLKSNAQQIVQKSAGTLTISIINFSNSQGNASVSLFNHKDGFPKSPEKAIKIVYSKITNNKSIVVFDNLPAGEYAVSVYHDENNNKKLDTNILGIPKEGVGASNNAKGHFGPPNYEDAKFNFSGNSQTVTIRINYL